MENHLTSYLTNDTSFQESWIECFECFYDNVLFVRNRECDKKGVGSVSERKKKTKNEAAISFWWYCKA